MRVEDKMKLAIIDNFGARVFDREELLGVMKKEYPEVSEGSILPASYCVNTESGGSVVLDEERFLFQVERGKYRIYNPDRDGIWESGERIR